MAQEIMVMGAIYEDVPSVRLPDSNGVFHPFTDTSDTTAVAADVAQGKTFHLADGTLATGTASGGGGGDEKAIIVSPGWSYTSSTDYYKMFSFSIEKTGTYTVSWVAIRYSTSGSAYGTQLRVNDEIIDTYKSFALVRTGQYVSVLQNLNAGDEVSIYAKGNGSNDIVVCNVIIKEE